MEYDEIKSLLFLVVIIVLSLFIGVLFAKGAFIWREAMLKQNERWYNDAKKLRYLN